MINQPLRESLRIFLYTAGRPAATYYQVRTAVVLVVERINCWERLLISWVWAIRRESTREESSQ